MRSHLTAAVIWCSVSSFAPLAAWGCPFCIALDGDTLLLELDSAKTAVLAELIRTPETDAGGKSSTGYRVVAVLKGEQRIKLGDTIKVAYAIPSPVGSVHLLVAAGDQSGQWKNPRGISKAGIEFVRGATRLLPAGKETRLEDRVRRLAFLLPYLVSNDHQLARSAYGEFATAPYAAVTQLKPILNHRELIAWIELELATAGNRRLIFTLLGVCHNPEVLRFVKAAMDDRLDSGKTTELDAIIAAYLTLAGREGLDEIDRRLLQPNEIPLAVRRAAAKALRFHVDCETVIEKERVIASCRLLLAHPKAADFVIRDLARWKDWKSLDTILKLWDTQAQENHWLKQPIVTYLESCPLPAARAQLALINQRTP